MEIKPFTMDHWEEFYDFINKHWAHNHPILNKKLFKWQYTGFGPNKGISNSKVLIVDDKLSGFRGVIPGIYQYKKNSETILDFGGSLAMWMVHPDLRGKGYGKKLLQETEKDLKILVSAGININTAVPIYLKNEYNYLEKLNRYVAPIERKGFSKLINDSVDNNTVEKWINTNKVSKAKLEVPIKIDPKEMEELWQNSIKDEDFFGLYRNAEFWEWRYMKSAYFDYIFFDDPDNSEVIVARIEKVSNSTEKLINDLKVLRIIEIIPLNNEVWKGNSLEKMTNLIKGVIKWAKQEGCCAVDFQISTSKLEALLLNSGFKIQSSDNKLTNLAGIFSPLKHNPSPINALWKIRNSQIKYYANPDNTYIVKSDNDMDRPIFV